MKVKTMITAVLAALITVSSASADLWTEILKAQVVASSNEYTQAISILDTALATFTNAAAEQTYTAERNSASYSGTLYGQADSDEGHAKSNAEIADLNAQYDAIATKYASQVDDTDLPLSARNSWLQRVHIVNNISIEGEKTLGNWAQASAKAVKGLDLLSKLSHAGFDTSRELIAEKYIEANLELGTAEADIATYLNSRDVHPSVMLEIFTRKYGANQILQKGNLDEIFSIITSTDKIKPMKFNEAIAARIAQDCQEGVKSVLRTEGKTFVGEVGRSNITAKVSPVIDVLNAPALNGIEAALVTCGVTVEPLDRTHIQTYGQQIGDQIMNGQLDPDPIKYLPHVYIALGYDLFQDWMNVYNEGGTFNWPAVQ